MTRTVCGAIDTLRLTRPGDWEFRLGASGFRQLPKYLLRIYDEALHVPQATEPTTDPKLAAPRLSYSTDLGEMYEGYIEGFLASETAERLQGSVQLVFTSPPFALNRPKRYGNSTGDEYVKWLGSLAKGLGDLLTDDGSLVVELGNAWESGVPTMSPVVMEALLAILKAGDFHLCQQFVSHNPARLPSPAQWVNVERIRVKDAFNHVWWMSRTERPKADNREVLVDYSPAMQRLLKRQSYNAGDRPSQHNIGETSFLTDNGGAIPSNVLGVSNTHSSDDYRKYCKDNNLGIHPARMAPGVAEFFVRFLTEKNDLVFDPFSGSNTTGAEAERLERKWLGVEPNPDYIEGSIGRFTGSVRLAD